MQVTKHYEHDHVILYVEEDGKRNCITLESDAQIRRLAECLSISTQCFKRDTAIISTENK